MPAGRRVTLTINDLRLEDTAACSFDYVEVKTALSLFFPPSILNPTFERFFKLDFCCVVLYCTLFLCQSLAAHKFSLLVNCQQIYENDLRSPNSNMELY